MSVTDSLVRAKEFLEAEIRQIDEACVRLDKRRAKLEESVRLLQEQILASDEEISSRTVTSSPEKPKEKKPSPTKIIRNHFNENPDVWYTTADLRTDTGFSSGSVGGVLQNLLNQGEIEKRGLGEDEEDDWRPGKAKWKYRLRREDRKILSVVK